jgi:hypothetical protein
MGTYEKDQTMKDSVRPTGYREGKGFLRHPIHYGLTKVSRINERLIQREKETAGER